MYCNQCGHALSEREKFCTVCGEAVGTPEGAANVAVFEKSTATAEIVRQGFNEDAVSQSAIAAGEKQKKKPTKKAVIIALGSLAVLAIAGIYIVSTSFLQKGKSAPEMEVAPSGTTSPSVEPEQENLPYVSTIHQDQVDGIVLKIRDLYNGTQAGLNRYITVESGKFKIYFDNGEIVLISDFTDGVTNYYYYGGKLYFVVITESDTQDITRLYFSNDELVRFIDKTGAIHDLEVTEDFIGFCDYIDRAYTVFDGIHTYVKENRPELLNETTGSDVSDEKICETIIASSQMKLLGKTYDQIVSQFGASTGAVTDIEYPASFSFSNTSYTFNFDGNSDGYIIPGRTMDENGSLSSNTYSGEEVDAHLDHDAKCREVQNVRLGDIINVPKGGFVPDENIFGEFTDELMPGYQVNYKGHSFSITTNHEARIYPDSLITFYSD